MSLPALEERGRTAAIRDGLMAFCCNAGLAVVAQMMDEELTEKEGAHRRAVSLPQGLHHRSHLSGDTSAVG